jgi:hypothetical protein
MEEWSTTSGDHHMLAAAAIRQLAALQSGEPVAAVKGYYNGRCIIQALDRSLVLPVGMALYATSQPVVDADAKREADSLAMSLWQKWYKNDSPDFELCDSVAGVITQISNMTSGLVREQDPQPVTTTPIASVKGWFHGECIIQPLDPAAVLPAGMALYAAPQPVVPDEWVKLLDEALDLTYRADIRPARSSLLQLRKALRSAGKGGE